MNNEPFFGQFAQLPSAFLAKLDRVIQSLSFETMPTSTTLSGYTLKPTDRVSSLQVNATAGALTVYLPEQPSGNRRRTITKTDSSANAVTVDGNGFNIDGATTQSLAAQYDSITVEPTGSEWLIVSDTR